MILDACANTRRWWPLGLGRHVAMDLAREHEPHVVARFEAMPFRSGAFDEVWADPPHRRGVSASSWRWATMRTRQKGLSLYGGWSSPEEYARALQGLRAEALRVLKPGGSFYLKLLVRDDPPDPQGRVVTSEWVHATLPGMAVVRRARSRVSWSRCEVLLLRERAA